MAKKKKTKSLRDSVLSYFDSKKNGTYTKEKVSPTKKEKQLLANYSFADRTLINSNKTKLPRITTIEDNEGENKKPIEILAKRLNDFIKSIDLKSEKITNNQEKITNNNFTKQISVPQIIKIPIEKKADVDKSAKNIKLDSLKNIKVSNVVKNNVMQIPSFQSGGVVTEPNLALVGDAMDPSGKPESEHILPESEFAELIFNQHVMNKPDFFAKHGPASPPKTLEELQKFTGIPYNTSTDTPHSYHQKLMFNEPKKDKRLEYAESRSQGVPFVDGPTQNTHATESIGENTGLRLNQELSKNNDTQHGPIVSVGGDTKRTAGAGAAGERETTAGGNLGGSGSAFLRSGSIPVWRQLLG